MFLFYLHTAQTGSCRQIERSLFYDFLLIILELIQER